MFLKHVHINIGSCFRIDQICHTRVDHFILCGLIKYKDLAELKFLLLKKKPPQFRGGHIWLDVSSCLLEWIHECLHLLLKMAQNCLTNALKHLFNAWTKTSVRNNPGFDFCFSKSTSDKTNGPFSITAALSPVDDSPAPNVPRCQNSPISTHQ